MKDAAKTRDRWWASEDAWAMIIAAILLLASIVATRPVAGDPNTIKNSLSDWITKPGSWESSAWTALVPKTGSSKLPGMLLVMTVSAGLFGMATRILDRRPNRFGFAFPVVFLLATLAYVLASQTVVKHYGLSYALWALLLGLVISNTIGLPKFLKPAVRTELYIKTGLVLLGAEVLVSKLLALGAPGIFISWVVTPIVLVATFWFGQRILRISSPTLNMVISADMSVCGVSAAIATAAACRAKKEELSVAIGLSLTFTVIMMVVMPAAIKALGLSAVVGGAWMGGTIDATGAVAAAGAMLGDEALLAATTIKMIQNILIGVIAFCVAVYWVTYQSPDSQVAPGLSEIWYRFPKFVLGFLAASLIFSALFTWHSQGEAIVSQVIHGSTKTLRGWCFCLAFVSIGLDTNFRELARHFHGGKPLLLYVVGQSFNLCLTLLMAWLMFEKVFPGAADALQK